MHNVLRIVIIVYLIFVFFNIIASGDSLIKNFLYFSLTIIGVGGLYYGGAKISSFKFYGTCIKILWIFWFVIQSIYIMAVASTYNSDAHAMHVLADLIQEKTVLEEGNFYFDYITRYVNNIPLAILEIEIIKLIRYFCADISFEQECIILSYVAACFADLAILFITKTSKELGGECAELISFILGLLMIGISEPATIFYSDIVALWTVPFGIFFFIRMLKSVQKIRAVNILLIGFISMGILIKPQVIIFWIATLMIGIIYSLKREDKSKIRKLVFLSILVLVVYRLENTMVEQWTYSNIASKEYIQDHEFIFLHYINMGLNDNSMGAYDGDDVTLTWNTVGKGEKIEYYYTSIQNRIASKGIKGLLIFWNRKLIDAVKDGSFSAPGIWKGEIINSSGIALIIQYYLMPKNEGWQHGIGVIIQNIYLLLLLFSAFAVCVNLYRKQNELLYDIVGLSVIGDFLFIISFEQNPRYMYVMLPGMITVFSTTISRINYICRRGRNYNN